MTSAFIRLSPFLSNRTFCGLNPKEYFKWLGADHGIAVVATEEHADVIIDGHFLGLTRTTLATALNQHVDIVGPNGERVIAHRAKQPDRPPHQLIPTEARPACDMTSFVLLEADVRRRIALYWTNHGVQIIDPSNTYIDAQVTIGASTILWPGVVLRGHTTVGAHTEVQLGCWIEGCTVGDHVLIKPHSVCHDATIGDRVHVGPMAHLRPLATLQEDVKVGNFVEVKKSVLAAGAKASHLSYIGDATVGPNANIGAGTITCNYDGHGKHTTAIGAGAFIGSNTALVAPVTIGDGAIVGAGSTISKNVPDDALAVERGTMRILDGKAPVLHERNRLSAAKARQKQ